MAYRRKQGTTPRSSSTFAEDALPPPPVASTADPSPPPSLVAHAIRASSAHRDFSLSSAYGESVIASARRDSVRHHPPSPPESAVYEYTSMKSLNENRSGFWGVLARKAKAILDDENATQQSETRGRFRSQMVVDTLKSCQVPQSYRSAESHQKTEIPSFQRNSDSIASSLNYIGGTIKNALEEGLTIVENRTADIIQETRKLHIRRKGGGSDGQNQSINKFAQHTFPQIRADLETQLKASRDVANAMSAKAKLLLRELKTVKADLAFAKERCAQLEEENRILRESHEKGNSTEDDDLIRLQLETLLAEKGRLAHENSVFARENRFLREIVEYHQLTMQDVVYVDEGIEEVTEVCPIQFPCSSTISSASHMQISPSTHNPASTTPQPPQMRPLTSPVLVPESCPIVPTPPILSPSQSKMELDKGTGIPTIPASKDAKQQQ